MQLALFRRLCISLTVAGHLTVLATGAAAEQRANVLFIAIDDLNDWLGCMSGHPNARTPNIDRLAERGTLFTNAHCQAPICGPSRASLLTGLHPSTTGIYGQIQSDQIRKANDAANRSVFLTEYFRNQGYEVVGGGKIFHGGSVPEGTFDEYQRAPRTPRPQRRFKWDRPKTSTDWGPYPDSDEKMPDYQTTQWAIERLQGDRRRPFFIAAGFHLPHVPWYVPPKWFDLHPLGSLRTPPYLASDYDDLPGIAIKVADVPMMPTTEWAKKTGEWNKIVQAYLACISFVDHYVGEILKALEGSPYAANTLVIFWSDHGYHIGEKNRFAKHSLWEEATRAPLIIAGPDLKGGQVCSKPVGLIDLYPTLLDLCRLPANQQNEGHSLRPLLEDPEAEWPHAVITTYGQENHSVRTEHLRYIRYEDGSEELYDHRRDDNEWHNLANDAEYRQIKEQLRENLPKTNAAWSPVSPYDYNDYLREAYKRRTGK